MTVNFSGNLGQIRAPGLKVSLDLTIPLDKRKQSRAYSARQPRLRLTSPVEIHGNGSAAQQCRSMDIA